MSANKEGSLKTYSEIVTALAAFLDRIYHDTQDYAYISVTERRFFNFFYLILADNLRSSDPAKNALAGRLLTNNGLLLQHRRLAEAYRQTGRFPRILIVDDLIIHGRSISKFLLQLEQAIAASLESLENHPLSALERERLHYRLVEAVDIRVFARSKNPILLGDGYAANLRYDYKLYANQLHRLTDLLSQSVDSAGVVNSSFVLSARCGVYAPESDDAEPSLLPQMRSDRGGWTYVPWISRERGAVRKLYAYVRPEFNSRGVYLISTVRFYENNNPYLTGYTIFGNMVAAPGHPAGLDSTCRALAEALSAAGSCYEPLCSILLDENPYVQQARGQLVSMIYSIAELDAFCADYELSWKNALRDNDLPKIVQNYGEQTRPAFLQLLASPGLYKDLSAIIRSSLCNDAEPIPFALDEERHLDAAITEGFLCDCALQLFGSRSAENKKAKRNLKDYLRGNPGKSLPLTYAALHSKTGDPHETDSQLRVLTAGYTNAVNCWEPVSKAALPGAYGGIPSGALDPCKIIDYINNCLERAIYAVGMRSEAQAYSYFDAPFLYRPDNHDQYVPGDSSASNMLSFYDYMGICPELPVSSFGRIAAYLALIDRGLLSSKLYYSGETGYLYTVCKAGERAMFYLPRKLSVFLPALSAVEKGSPMMNLSEKEAVRRFVSTALAYEGSSEAIQVSVDSLRRFIDEYLEILHSCGQLFSGWNFAGLTHQQDPLYQQAQQTFIQQAQAFILKR